MLDFMYCYSDQGSSLNYFTVYQRLQIVLLITNNLLKQVSSKFLERFLACHDLLYLINAIKRYLYWLYNKVGNVAKLSLNFNKQYDEVHVIYSLTTVNHSSIFENFYLAIYYVKKSHLNSLD